MTNVAPQLQEPARRFVQLWAESFGMVLGQIAGSPFQLELADASSEVPAASANDTHITITAAGAVRGEMTLRIPQASAVALIKIFVGEQKDSAAELTPDDRAAVEELLRQVAGHASTSAKPQWGELPLNLALSQAPTWPPAASGWIRSVAGAPAEIAIEWQLSAAINTSLAAAQPEQKNPTNSAVNLSASPDVGRIGFFMDLELEVTLRFGGRDILLKDVLQLGPGSLLELDREIQDPADLLLDGKLIARGEVVMVDGNFGLRVTEIFTAPVAA